MAEAAFLNSMGLFSQLLPSSVSCVELPTGIPGAVEALNPVEARGAKDFASRRFVEFAEGRFCAHAALSKIDDHLASQAIGRASNRAPMWPGGIVGSISHCEDIRAAAVARNTEIYGLGIDIENIQILNRDIVASILTPEEMTALRGNASDARTDTGNTSGEAQTALGVGVSAELAELIIFSAKESLYKLWSPIVGSWLGYEEAQIQLQVDGPPRNTRFSRRPAKQGKAVTGSLAAKILKDYPSEFDRLEGKWQVQDNRVLTAVWIPA